jgi:hypothetical protein
MEGAFIERGCSAPYSPIQADNTWWWLDHERGFGRLEGRNFKIVSQPVNTVLLALTDVSDLHTNHFQFNNRRFIALTSANSGLTLVYDYVLDAWYQWGVWVKESHEYIAWPVHTIAHSESWSRYVVIGTDGLLYSISGEASDARMLLRSAHISHGTLQKKQSHKLVLRMKKGYPNANPAYNYAADGRDYSGMSLRWRDNNSAFWKGARLVPIGGSGQYDNIVTLHRFGIYDTRQWEFTHTGYEPFALVSIEEDVEVLGG